MKAQDNAIFLPLAVNIADKQIVIIGGGNVGWHKAVLLNRFTDRIKVISPDFIDEFRQISCHCIRKCYEPDDVRDAFLVYACTDDRLLNEQIRRDAESMGKLVNVCDNPKLCDFISPAIYRDGDICISVTSNGSDVKRSVRIRNRIQDWIGNDIDKIK